MRKIQLVLAGAVALSSAKALAQPVLNYYGTVNLNSYSGYSAWGLSGDGSTIAGLEVGGTLLRAARLVGTSRGRVPQGAPNDQPIAFAINQNGNMMAGTTIRQIAGGSTEVPFLWRGPGQPMVSLPRLPGSSFGGVRGLSSDGSVVAGYCVESAESRVVPVRWLNDTEIVQLELPTGYTGGGVRAVGPDGVGMAGSLDGPDGTIAARWLTSGGVSVLTSPQGSTESRALAISNGGLVSVGYSRILQEQATLWNSDGSSQVLGVLPNDSSSNARAVSRDGSIVVGWSSSGSYLTQRGFLWTQGTGLVDLNSWLTGIGTDLRGVQILDCVGISDDGRTLAGTGLLNGLEVAWRVSNIPSPQSVSILAILGARLGRRSRRPE